MKNDELFRSLYRMAEEYDRLVSPLTEQLKINDRWHEITSPILRVAEIVKGFQIEPMNFNLTSPIETSISVHKYFDLKLDNL